MNQKAKKVDEKKEFLDRFLEQNRKKPMTQAKLAEEIGVARSTVAGWLAGASKPGMDDLIKLAKFYGVSTDYLLGLSGTESPDVTVRAAMEYTGLSEAAVERLHIGLDDFKCDGIGVGEEEKKENLRIASALIQSRSFTNVIHYLSDIVEAAFLERFLEILDDRHLVCDSPEDDTAFCFAKSRDRDAVRAGLIYAFKMSDPHWEKHIWKHPNYMNDEELSNELGGALMKAGTLNEMSQFHAAKVFNGYIDQMIEESRKKAEQKYEAK